MSSEIITIQKTWNGIMTSHSYYLTMSISSLTGDIVISVDAPYYDDPKPPLPAGKFQELHEYEVVELFFSGIPYDFSSETNVPYLELGIGPHGHYYLSFFMKEADWDNVDTSIDLETAPKVVIDPKTNRWTAEILIPFYLLPEPTCGEDLSVSWNFNAYAIHGIDGNREYLAYSTVPGSKPNFHQLQYFQHIELYETMEVRSIVDRTQSIANEKLGRSPKKDTGGGSVGKSSGETEHTITDLLKLAVLEEDEEGEEEEIVNEKPFTNASPLSAREKVSSQANRAGSPTPTPGVPSIEVIARQLKQTLEADLPQKAVELEEKFSRHIQKEEFVVLHEFLWKRKGISYKKRKLILTSKPRLIYFDPNGVYKGSIQWSMTKRPQLLRINDKKFNIILNDNSRTYHFSNSQLGSDVWMKALTELMIAQKSYIRSSLLPDVKPPPAPSEK